jgi:hypothetical protein
MDWGMRVKTLRRRLAFYFFAVALAAWGCGSSDKPTPVHGRVFYRGRPLPGGTIVFTPDLERGGFGPLATGEIDSDGRYTLHTQEQLGVVPGWHRVTIASPASAVAPGQEASPPLIDIPRKYSDPHQSGLLRQVRPGVGAEHDFFLE